MLGLSVLVQVNHLEVERKAKLWRRTVCCLWLALNLSLDAFKPGSLVPVAVNIIAVSTWPCFAPW